jgi:glyoxylase-like metal-dependent hydrolase (beta-lactamase superfamily II)
MKQEQLPAEDDAVEVAPGVVRVQLPIMLPGLGHVNCYVLEDERGVTLVDPGLPGPEAHAELARRLGRAGYPVERVHTVLVTHSHPDHFGGAGRLKVEQHCDVVAHEVFSTPFDRAEAANAEAAAAAALADGDLDELVDVASEDTPRPTTLREVLFGEGDLPEVPPRVTPWGGEGFRPSEAELAHMRSWDRLSKEGLLSLDPTVRVADDQVVTLGRGEWVVVHTPGHTGDHICLFDPVHGTLLSGDHVLPSITPHISGLTPEPDSLAQFFDGLRRVAAIDGVTQVLPAHGLPFTDLSGRVDAIIEHHEERLALLLGIADDLGDADVTSYSQRLFRERSWGPMAESETYAHLEHLRLQGRMATRRDDDGQLRYRPVAPLAAV